MQASHGNSRKKSQVVVLATGGTIAGAAKSATRADYTSGRVTLDAMIAAVPQIQGLAHVRGEQLANVGSQDITFAIMIALANRINDLLTAKDVHGVVVTHGTDTMAEGAFFLDLTLTSKKPVVFVGAMRDASAVSPDGPANILNAVIQATSPQARDWGVTVALNQYVNAAWDVVKTQTTNVQTFDSGERGYLGYIQSGKVKRFRGRGPRITLPIPAKLPKVVFLSTFAGDDGSLARYAVDSGAKGLVVEAVGAGNVNPQVYKAIKYALAKGVSVVITTRVYRGAVEPIYGDLGGGLTLQKDGCILGGSLRGPKARLLLMLALPQVKSATELRKFFH